MMISEAKWREKDGIFPLGLLRKEKNVHKKSIAAPSHDGVLVKKWINFVYCIFRFLVLFRPEAYCHTWTKQFTFCTFRMGEKSRSSENDLKNYPHDDHIDQNGQKIDKPNFHNFRPLVKISHHTLNKFRREPPSCFPVPIFLSLRSAVTNFTSTVICKRYIVVNM